MLYVRNIFDSLFGTRSRATGTLVVLLLIFLTAHAKEVEVGVDTGIQEAELLAGALGRGIMKAIMNLGVPVVILAMLWGYAKSKFK